MPRIHAICLVRDEADIIESAVRAALRWADFIYVMDDSSSDGTWEILQRLAEEDPRVVLRERNTGPFTIALRQRVVEGVRDRAELGDWWAWLDADEFFVDDPRQVLARVPLRYGVVHSASIEYYFTDRDLEAYDAAPEGYTRNWTPDTPRYYATGWGEERFFRHIPGVRWGAIAAQAASPIRIRLRHLQYRTPPQIERRVRRRVSSKEFWHEKEASWSPTGSAGDVLVLDRPEAEFWPHRVVRSSALRYDAGDGGYEIDEAALPDLSPALSVRERLLRLWAVSHLVPQAMWRRARHRRSEHRAAT
ncbi:glycosyltransferase family 2 protein [Naasia aerilata]|uniref:Glycosyl transferase family 2 n=1 Tax=Naasia aerilata TaxID=1162966 RepID=A0ABM8G8E0_9MICO|nr:glycosyltransferase family 2 protein [Naasia aerilata]BDZ44367.1 hypothetical protein GCM10025866_02760 [Naasia aerilata]